MARRAHSIFISHARQDEPLARDLARSLAKVGLQSWWTGRIRPGENWAEAAGRALKAADALVWLCSPEWSKSAWTKQEIEFALSGTRFERRVFPIIVRPGGQFPWILKEFQIADLSRRKATRARLAIAASRIAERLAAETADPHPRLAASSGS